MKTEVVERKISYPTLQKNEHDFRKEFKGSVLEQKFTRKRKESKIQATWKSITEWIFQRKREPKEVFSPIEKVPNEILHQIFSHLDEKSSVTCRRVCRRWQEMTEFIQEKGSKQPVTISRLVISSSRKGLELRRVNYDTQKTNLLIIPWNQVNNFADFVYSFRNFLVQRIVIKDLVLTDIFVDFIRQQLAHCDLSKLFHFSLHKIDFSEANSITLHRLLAPVAKKIEVLEVTQCYGMRADSLTDSHLAQLNAQKLRRVHIDGVRFAALRKAPALKIGNSSLKHFSAVENFPVLMLDRCSVTTEAVCQYTQQWLDHLGSQEGVFTPVCTVKRCIHVNCNEFEEACKRRGLNFRHRRASDSMSLYSVQGSQGHRHSLSLQISGPEKEGLETQKISQ